MSYLYTCFKGKDLFLLLLANTQMAEKFCGTAVPYCFTNSWGVPGPSETNPKPPGTADPCDDCLDGRCRGGCDLEAKHERSRSQGAHHTITPRGQRPGLFRRPPSDPTVRPIVFCCSLFFKRRRSTWKKRDPERHHGDTWEHRTIRWKTHQAILSLIFTCVIG